MRRLFLKTYFFQVAEKKSVLKGCVGSIIIRVYFWHSANYAYTELKERFPNKVVIDMKRI